MTNNIDVNVGIIWKSSGLREIISEAQNEIKRLADLNAATPQRVQQVASAAQGRLAEIGDRATRSQDIKSLQGALDAAILDVQVSGEKAFQRMGQALVRSVRGAVDLVTGKRVYTGADAAAERPAALVTPDQAGEDASRKATARRAENIAKLKFDLDNGAANQIAEEIRERKKLSNAVQDAAGHQAQMGKLLADEARIKATQRAETANVQLGDQDRFIQPLAQANIDEARVQRLRRGFEASGTTAEDVRLEALTRSQEQEIERNIRITQAEFELNTGVAEEIGKERVVRQRLNRQIEAEVRKQTDVDEVAADRLDQRRFANRTRQAELAAETPADRSDQVATNLAERQRRVALALEEQTQLRSASGQQLGLSEVTLTRQTEQLRAVRARMLAGDSEYIAASAATTAANQELARRVRRQVQEQTDPAEVGLDRLQTRRFNEESKLAELRGVTPADADRTASIAVESRRITAENTLAEQAQLRTAVGRRLLEAEEQVARGTAQIQADRQEMLAADRQYIEATIRQAKAKEELSARTTLVRAGEDDPAGGRDALVARAAVVQRAEADRRAAAVANQTTEADIQAGVERRVAEARLNNAKRVQEREILKQAISSGEFGGTGFQRIQARLSPSADRLPEDYSTFGQFVGQKATTTAGFAVAGLATGALLFGLKNAIDEAEQLQQTFTLLRSQMEALGKGGDFEGMAQRIRSIATETGISADKVAQFTARLTGVFGDPERAVKEAESGMKLAVVTGTEFGTLLQDLVPAAKAFGVSLDDVGNLAVAIRERFGIAEAATTDFLGRVAPVAQEAGFSIQEMAVIGAASANAVGKDMGSIADLFSRVVPALQESQSKIYAVYQSKPQTAGLVEPLAKLFAQGDTAGAFNAILGSYDKLDAVQQKYLVNSIASRREAPLLTAVLNNNKQILDELSSGHLNAEATAGKLNGRFKDLQDTVKNTQERIKESLNQIAEAIFNSGLGDVFYDLANGVKAAIGVLGALLGIFQKIDQASQFLTKPLGLENGLLKTLVEFGGVAIVATKALNLLSVARSGDAEASTRASAAIGRLIGVKVEDTAASERDALAESELAGARNVEGDAALLTAQRAGTSQAYLSFPRRVQNSASEVESLYEGGGATAKYGLGSKLLQGGRFLRSSSADAAAIGATGEASGATAFPIAGLVIAGVLATKSSYDSTQAQYQGQSADLASKIKDKDRQKIQNLLDAHDDWSTKLGNSIQEALFREDSVDTLLQKEANRQDSAAASRTVGGLVNSGKSQDFAKRVSDANLKNLENFFNQTQETKQLGLDVGFNDQGPELSWDSQAYGVRSVSVTRDKLSEALPRIKAEAEAGRHGAKEAQAWIEGVLNGQKDLADLAKASQDAAGTGDINKAFELAGGSDQYVIQTFAEAQQQHQLGKISNAEYLSQIKRQREILMLQLSASGGQDRAKALNEVFKVDKEIEDLKDQILKRQVAEQTTYIEFSGTSTPKTESLAVALEKFTQTSTPGQYADLPGLLAKVNDAWQERLNLIADPLQRYEEETKNPPKVPEVLRRASLDQALADSEPARTALDALARVNPSIADASRDASDQLAGPGEVVKTAGGVDLTKQLADIAIKTNRTMVEVVHEYIQTRIKALKDSGVTDENDPRLSQLEQQDRDVEKNFGDIKNPADVILAEQRKADKDRLDGLLANRRGQLAVQAATVSGDPIASAETKVRQAESDYQDAQDRLTAHLGTQSQVDEAYAGVVSSRLGLASAFHNLAKIHDRWAEIMANGDPVLEAAAQAKQAQDDLAFALQNNDQGGAETARQDLQKIAFQQIRNQQNIHLADLGIQAARDARDPVASARDALGSAQYEESIAVGVENQKKAAANTIKAQQALEDAEKARVESFFQIQDALDEKDPGKTAQHALERAQRAFANATSVEQQNQALADQIKAQHGIEDYIKSVFQSQVDLAIAIAQAAGDTVGAAQIAYDSARAKLDEALREGKDPNGPEVNGLRSEAVAKGAALRDAGVQEQERRIEFLRSMDRLTTSQVVAAYQSLLQVPGLAQQTIDDITLKIHELKKTAEQNYQFNLPSNINLPTFYEARRATQTPGGPGAYTDNRQVAVNINVTNANDLAQVEQVLADHLGTNRYAPISKRYS